jgi:hypothetical protein
MGDEDHVYVNKVYSDNKENFDMLIEENKKRPDYQEQARIFQEHFEKLLQVPPMPPEKSYNEEYRVRHGGDLITLLIIGHGNEDTSIRIVDAGSHERTQLISACGGTGFSYFSSLCDKSNMSNWYVNLISEFYKRHGIVNINERPGVFDDLIMLLESKAIECGATIQCTNKLPFLTKMGSHCIFSNGLANYQRSLDFNPEESQENFRDYFGIYMISSTNDEDLQFCLPTHLTFTANSEEFTKYNLLTWVAFQQNWLKRLKKSKYKDFLKNLIIDKEIKLSELILILILLGYTNRIIFDFTCRDVVEYEEDHLEGDEDELEDDEDEVKGSTEESPEDSSMIFGPSRLTQLIRAFKSRALPYQQSTNNSLTPSERRLVNRKYIERIKDYIESLNVKPDLTSEEQKELTDLELAYSKFKHIVPYNISSLKRKSLSAVEAAREFKVKKSNEKTFGGKHKKTKKQKRKTKKRKTKKPRKQKNKIE